MSRHVVGGLPHGVLPSVLFGQAQSRRAHPLRALWLYAVPLVLWAWGPLAWVTHAVREVAVRPSPVPSRVKPQPSCPKFARNVHKPTKKGLAVFGYRIMELDKE